MNKSSLKKYIGYIVPHPPIMVPEIGRDNLDDIKSTVKAMNEISEEIADLNPDTLVFISPHSPMASEAFAIKGYQKLQGSFDQFSYPELSYCIENDLELVTEIEKTASSHSISTVLIGEETTGNIMSYPLDHGVLAPLSFIVKNWIGKIVSISISGESYKQHFQLGKAIREAIENLNINAIFIASGDMSHRLTTDAPAGYNPRGKIFDSKIEEIINNADLSPLFKLNRDLIEDAGECGLRSIFCLSGFLSGYNIKSDLKSYEGPFGVGYLVARLEVSEPNEKTFPVKLATESINSFIKDRKTLKVPKDTPNFLKGRAATFVSIKKSGQLRGCIGTTSPQQGSTAQEIIKNAISAATQDPRFDEVQETELDELVISVDILTEPEEVDDISMLDPKKYGVIVEKDFKKGLLLPDLEGIDTAEIQLRIAKQKAGIRLDDDVKIYRFQVKRYF